MFSQPDLDFSISQYNSKNGLKQNTVQNILYTADSRFLLSTYNGLIQFDGKRFVEIPYSKASNEKYFQTVVKTENPERYFAKDGVQNIHQIYPNGSRIQLPSYIKNVRQLTAFQDRIYLFTGQNQLYSYHVQKKEINELHPKELTAYNKIFATKNQLYLTTLKGIYTADKTYSQLTPIPIQITGGDLVVANLVSTENGHTYALVNNTFYKYDVVTKSFKPLMALPKPDGETFTNFAADNKENIYLITKRKLFHLHVPTGAIREIVVSSHSIIYRTLFYSEELNLLMLGTEADGLFILKPNSIKVYNEDNGFINNGCSFITTGKTDKDVFIGTMGNVLYHYENNALKPYTSFTEDFTSAAYINNELWMGVYGGAILFNKDDLTKDLLKVSGNAIVFIKAIDSLVWVGHLEGLSVLNSKKEIIKTFKKEIPRAVTSILPLKNGQVVVAGKTTIYFLKNLEVIQKFDIKDGLNVNDIRAIYESKNGLIFFGTYGKGLFLYDNGKLININAQRGCLLPNDIFCLAKDKNNNIWMTSNNGLYCINEEKLFQFIRKQTPLLIPFYFDEFYGLKVEEFNGGFMPNYCFSDSKLLLPNIKGFSEVDPEIIKTEEGKKPITLINEIVVNDSLKYSKTDTIAFGGVNNTLLISFYADNFRPSGNLHYQYMLEGIDKQWSAPSTLNEARYQLLPPGTYVFKVKAVNAFSTENEADAVIITVIPIFIQTITFKILIVAGILTLLLLFITGRIRSIRKIAEEKSSYEAKIARVELKALHAQINPHFIFNCLNSIKYCVSENNFEQADKYIDHFSILLRRFLEYSNRDSIRINEEAEILMHYLELEKYRFDNKFNYEIDVDSSLRAQYIPTNIIQPIVENAIKHGIAHAENLCNLRIQIIRHENLIRCIIDDDGIGRDAAFKINASFKKHKSKGLGLIVEKKEILKKTDGIDLNFEIIDKKSSSGQSLGTKVIIDIPLAYDKSADNRRRSHRTESDEEIN